MGMIVTPDCPQCHGEGRVYGGGLNKIPCGQCIRRWDLANPPPSPKFMDTNETMADFVYRLRHASRDIRTAMLTTYTDLHDNLLSESEKIIAAAADFIASHDPSTKKQLSEAEAPYCLVCFDAHPPIPDGCKGW